jgi:hypothetical protein
MNIIIKNIEIMNSIKQYTVFGTQKTKQFKTKIISTEQNVRDFNTRKQKMSSLQNRVTLRERAGWYSSVLVTIAYPFRSLQES